MQYTVQPGDTMHSIALKFNVPLPLLLAANPQVTNPNLLQIGAVLEIPTPTTRPGGGPAGTPAATAPPGTDPPADRWCTVMLEPVDGRVAHPATALVRIGRQGYVMVATANLPPPRNFGTYDHYTVWVARSTNPLHIRDYFDLTPTRLTGAWINHKYIQDLGPHDEIIVNLETQNHGPYPGNGLYVLRGRLSRCR